MQVRVLFGFLCDPKIGVNLIQKKNIYIVLFKNILFKLHIYMLSFEDNDKSSSYFLNGNVKGDKF